MSNLGKALARIGKESSVKVPWESLGGSVHPLRGQLCIVLAEPGVGKSAFSLNWAAKLGGPSVILSLDTDLGTQAVRLASLSAQVPMSIVQESPATWADYLDRRTRNVRMYDFTMDPTDLKDVVEAETEYWGAPPALTVVDNLGNIVRDGSYEEYRKAFAELHRVARRYDTFVLALHHVRRSSTNGAPPTMSSGLYSGEQEAEIVLGLYADPREPGVLNVSVLKNRSGISRPDGSLAVPLTFNRETLEVTDMTPHHQAMRAMAGRS